MTKTPKKVGRPKKKHPGGRPTKMTPQTIDKLEQAFSLGCTDIEACLFADISVDLLYKYQRENPEYIKRKEALKENPVLLARTSVVNSLPNSPELALKYLERKRKDEFSTQVNNNNRYVDKDGEDLHAKDLEILKAMGFIDA